jgi:hypothetical protein
MRGNIRVFCRARKDDRAESCLKFLNDQDLMVVHPQNGKKMFSFDKAFDIDHYPSILVTEIRIAPLYYPSILVTEIRITPLCYPSILVTEIRITPLYYPSFLVTEIRITPLHYPSIL